MTRSTLHLILGQTATGKTARASTLAREIGGELVNCDSRQIYRHLDIITGKTDNPRDIPLHLVDIVDPPERFSSVEYARRARLVIDDILSRGKVPIVVGGTGPYAHMLLHADLSSQENRSPSISPIDTKLNSYGVKDLQDMLYKLNANVFDSLNTSDKANPRRLVSAIMRARMKSRAPIPSTKHTSIEVSCTCHTIILLHRDSQSLTRRITDRVHTRLDMGAIEECRLLRSRGYTAQDPGLATIGYQSLFAFLDGSGTIQTMIDDWIVKERQYAKRQKTYLLKYFSDATTIFV